MSDVSALSWLQWYLRNRGFVIGSRTGVNMRKFFESGLGFMVVALLCFAAGVLAENGAVFISVGAFWLVFAIIVRSKYAKKDTSD